MTAIEDGLREIPNDFRLREIKASVLAQTANITAAIELYEQLLKEQPGSMVVANNFASLVSDHRTDKETIERAHAAALVLARSEVPQFKDTLGWLYYLRGDYRNAQVLLEQAVEALPNVAVVRFHLGMTYRAQGEQAKAREQLKLAANLDSDSGALGPRIRQALEQLQ
jgi:Tfp pilus assembly protein PilF